MGPRPLGRGRAGVTSAAYADDERQWGRDLSAAEGPWQRSQRRWRGRRQWGRDLSAAEGGSPEELKRYDSRRQWGRDLSAAEGWITSRCYEQVFRVNGAATSRPRKAPRLTDPSITLVASMGPRPLGRGRNGYGHDNRPPQRASMGPRPLGRGRAYSTCARMILDKASMGPRPLGRGRCLVFFLPLLDGGASMGPRPLGRGRMPAATAGRQSYNLRQWGRDLSAAEGAWASPDANSASPRQWGRDLSAAEGWFTRCISEPTSAGVNGAATSRPRKVWRNDEWRYRSRASMGPRPLGRGRRTEGAA